MLLLAKAPVDTSNSWNAQGGVAAAVGEDDSPALHAADTFRAGRGLCRESAVAGARRGGAGAHRRPRRARRRVRRRASAARAATRVRRVVHAGGAETGKAISEVLADRVREHPRITVADGVRVRRALGERRPLRRRRHRPRRRVAAPATILATGGYAALWERTTNPRGALGEGLVLAYRAGAALADLEFVQFHPTALLDDGFLLSEALRGEGAVLVDDDGNRFTDELAPRDVVARAIAERGHAGLDLRGDRARALPRPDGDARARRLRPGRRADPGLAGRALHGRRHRHRPRRRDDRCPASTRPASAPRPASTARTGSRRTRCSSASSSGAGPGSPRSAEPAPAPAEPPAPAAPEPPVTAALRHALWEDAGVIRSAEGLERLARAPALLPRLIAESALARAREPRRATSAPTSRPRTTPSAATSSSAAGTSPVLERWS